jgi:hypothetical protein
MRIGTPAASRPEQKKLRHFVFRFSDVHDTAAPKEARALAGAFEDRLQDVAGRSGLARIEFDAGIL